MEKISSKAAAARMMDINLRIKTDEVKQVLYVQRRSGTVDPAEISVFTDKAKKYLPQIINVVSALLDSPDVLNDFFVLCDPYVISALDKQLRQSIQYFIDQMPDANFDAPTSDSEFFRHYIMRSSG